MTKINWKEELLDSALFNKKQEKLLKNAAKSLTDSWLLGVLYTRWKQLKGIREPVTPNYQSLFLAWEQRLAKREFYVLIEEDVLYPDW